MSVKALTTSLSALRLAARPFCTPTTAVAGPSRRFQSTHSHVGLGTLSGPPGAKSYDLRRGRGNSSTHGGHTSGRGHKGAGARTGKSIPYVGFAGGQTPVHKSAPKRGFFRYEKRLFHPVNIAKLQLWISQGRIDPSKTIDIRAIVHSNLVHGMSRRQGVKLLGAPDPNLPLPPLTLKLSKFGEDAANHIIAAGGTCTAVYHDRVSLMQELRPQKFPEMAEEARMEAKPLGKRKILYYSDPSKHGFLHKIEPDRRKMYETVYGFQPTLSREEKRPKKVTVQWNAPPVRLSAISKASA